MLEIVGDVGHTQIQKSCMSFFKNDEKDIHPLAVRSFPTLFAGPGQRHKNAAEGGDDIIPSRPIPKYGVASDVIRDS